LSIHVTAEEQARFCQFLLYNCQIGQVAPVYRTNTRTKAIYGMLVSMDFALAEYNATYDGILTREQAYLILRKRSIQPYVRPAKPAGSCPTTALWVLPLATD
jgi:hypothetical protein